MNVSLHAISPDVRRSLIGRHAQRGIDVLERLLEAGIEVHGQIVLCAGINDGDELRRTLDWVEQWPTFTSLALVPMGYTKYSKRFSSSFSEDQEASRAVVRMLEPYQARARKERGITRFQLSDEFYLDADLPIPAAETYDGYPQFYDGIGMLRSFLDEADEVCAGRVAELFEITERLAANNREALLVCGEAAAGVVTSFCEEWARSCGLADARVRPWAIRNDYYGGDVNVTGLIVGCDLLAQLPEDLSRAVVILPEVMFNFDHVTLDGNTQARILEELHGRGGIVHVAMTTPHDLLDALREM
jgi:NifB/MoaA-like Fe-S oxidoreductase